VEQAAGFSAWAQRGLAAKAALGPKGRRTLHAPVQRLLRWPPAPPLGHVAPMSRVRPSLLQVAAVPPARGPPGGVPGVLPGVRRVRAGCMRSAGAAAIAGDATLLPPPLSADCALGARGSPTPWQFGEPVYPPSHVSFQAGPSPWSLAPPSIKYPVAATGAPAAAPAASAERHLPCCSPCLRIVGSLV
jgi:hypothetical protein